MKITLSLLSVLALLVPAHAVEATANPHTPTAVRIGVPEPTNLQFLTFWVAVGAGYFEDLGLDPGIHQRAGRRPAHPHALPSNRP